MQMPYQGYPGQGAYLTVQADVQAVQEAALQGPASPIEAYSSDLHILDTLQDSQQIASMTLKDWHQAQEVDPVLSLVTTRLREGMLGKGQSKATDPSQSLSVWKRMKPSHTQKGCPV